VVPPFVTLEKVVITVDVPTFVSTVTLFPGGVVPPTVHGTTGVPVQVPPEHVSFVVHTSPSSHGRLFAVWRHAPAPSHWSVVQTLPSLVQADPAGCFASAGHAAPLPEHVSGASHSPVAGRQTVDADKKPSAGHAGLEPVQLSALSQMPADERHTVPAFPAGCWQATLLPSH
jgi:hypothetical protein